MVSHIVGAALSAAALTLCVTASALHGDPWAVVSSAVYGVSLLLLYTVSSVYHGIRPSVGKLVMQVIDHCAVYVLIAGTYTPVLLVSVRTVSAPLAWGVFGFVWGTAVLATVLTAVDLRKYRVFSMVCCMGIGWCIVFILPVLLQAVALRGFLLILTGGVTYTAGAVLYGLGVRMPWMHSVFHLFVIAGSAVQFFAILLYVI